jgi:norsolorinic acid ketoreductase
MSTASIDTVYLVTGVNRGIGKCIVESLLFRSNTTVIGTMRTVNDRTCAHLHELPKAKGSKLIFVAMEMSRPDSITDAVAGLENIDKIDVVIANAASE